ncbi:hypothetical protein [Humibacillus xanthopallidus]|uniref:hypothetical protein n=1 Tax=Humibacillus xanthopallidus TaxID=412689 RepID=UPI00163A8A2C|nr:hypothetical protein [Humibacillus xanthopallidus]
MSRLRLVLPALAAAVLAVPALASCTASSSANTGPGTVDRASTGSTASARASSAGVDEVTALVKDRFGAVTKGDRTAWLAALAPDVGDAARTTQGRIFDRMRAMGVTDLRVVSIAVPGPPSATTSATPMSAAATSTTATSTAAASTAATSTTPTSTAATSTAATSTTAANDIRARLTATYRLGGFDTSPRTFVVDLALEADPRASNGATGAGPTPRLRSWDPAERLQPWDLAGLRVRRTADALLLVVGPQARLDELDRHVRAAARNVSAVWGRSEPSVWVAPGTDDDAARLLGRTAAAMTRVAAVTDGPLEPGESAGADRIVVAPTPWSGLSGVGRDVVLTHELTHASVRATTTRSVPDWLAEGFAELVAYRTVTLPERQVVAPALDLVRTQGLPTALPTDAAFDPATGRLEAAYGLALLAVRELADRKGMPGLVRLYREAAGGLPAPTASLGDPEAVTDLALERAGTDRATLVRQWRSRIASLTAQ